jgi:hypothetical protein
VVEETDKIKQHIEDERESLSHNLDEIEYRFKDATDLKAHFDRNTGLILGAAVAGGFLLSMALGRSSRSGSSNRPSAFTDRDATIPTRSNLVSPHLNRLSETVDNIVGGLVGVFSDKLRSFVADAAPGFREQYDSFKHEPSSGHFTTSTVGR